MSYPPGRPGFASGETSSALSARVAHPNPSSRSVTLLPRPSAGSPEPLQDFWEVTAHTFSSILFRLTAFGSFDDQPAVRPLLVSQPARAGRRALGEGQPRETNSHRFAAGLNHMPFGSRRRRFCALDHDCVNPLLRHPPLRRSDPLGLRPGRVQPKSIRMPEEKSRLAGESLELDNVSLNAI